MKITNFVGNHVFINDSLTMNGFIFCQYINAYKCKLKWLILGFGRAEQIKEVYNFPRNVFPWEEIKQGKTTLEDILSQS